MDDKLIEAANTILADILMEAAYIVAESEDLISVSAAIAQAIFNLADDASPSASTH